MRQLENSIMLEHILIDYVVAYLQWRIKWQVEGWRMIKPPWLGTTIVPAPIVVLTRTTTAIRPYFLIHRVETTTAIATKKKTRQHQAETRITYSTFSLHEHTSRFYRQVQLEKHFLHNSRSRVNRLFSIYCILSRQGGSYSLFKLVVSVTQLPTQRNTVEVVGVTPGRWDDDTSRNSSVISGSEISYYIGVIVFSLFVCCFPVWLVCVTKCLLIAHACLTTTPKRMSTRLGTKLPSCTFFSSGQYEHLPDLEVPFT